MATSPKPTVPRASTVMQIPAAVFFALARVRGTSWRETNPEDSSRALHPPARRHTLKP